MNAQLPTAGAANAELARAAHQWWLEAAVKAGLNLTGFDAEADLPQRLAWAQSQGLDIGTILSRYSSKMQHSTESQVTECLEFAARHKIYVPPEYLCVDEGVSGRKLRRDGLERVQLILKERRATVLLVYKVSRLFRVGYLGFKFFQEELCEAGLRGISISQGIDTADGKAWKVLAYVHGIMDEMLLTTIADFVRSGIKTIFTQGWTTGALTVGYRRVRVPGAKSTNLGRPRTMPEVDPDVAALIREHYQLIRDGMPIHEGLRCWVAAGGPCDPRSTTRRMTYPAYRRMLSNLRYTGRWGFGRKRNVWSSKRDYTRQVVQPDTEVALFECEELRIVDDELFAAVQERLAKMKLGPRSHKKRTNLQLWDLVTDCFWCPACEARYYQTGSRGHAMGCKHGTLCPSRVMVRRQEAVRAVCEKLTELLQQDAELIEQITCRAQQIDSQPDEELASRLAAVERRLEVLNAKIHDLQELAGQGSPEDQKSLKATVVAAWSERSTLQLERARLIEARDRGRVLLTPQRVREILGNLMDLLEAGASGKLGQDVMYRAATVFHQLTGGRIAVHIDRRAGRKRHNVPGAFAPQVLRVVEAEAGSAGFGREEAQDVTVWLRKPPRLDLLADRVHELIDVAGMSYREAAKALLREGHKANSGNVWCIYQRYYEIRGLPVPERPYNNGHPRKVRQAS